nr:MAG TPA: hypothetical protein [Caudoviricetes sp.]
MNIKIKACNHVVPVFTLVLVMKRRVHNVFGILMIL